MTKIKETLAQKAQRISIELHNGQYRKDKITPYITHPETVVNFLKLIGITNEEILASAWLHDVLEDCNVSRDFIRKEFGVEVERIVSALTRDTNKENYYRRIINSDYAVKIIKLADVVHNCSNIHYPHLSRNTAERKVKECKEHYLELARSLSPIFYKLIVGYLDLYELTKNEIKITS